MSAKLFLTRTCYNNASRFFTTAKDGFKPKLRLFETAKKQPTYGQFRTMKTVAKTLALIKPVGESVFIRNASVAGVSAVGLATMCSYGLGLLDEVLSVKKTKSWPKVVKKRIQSTYAHFGVSLLITGAAAVAVSKIVLMMQLPLTPVIAVGFVSMLVTGSFCTSLPYKKGIGKKQIAWALFACAGGCLIAPIAIMGGRIVVRAACYTGGAVGGLSALAMCAPSDKFLEFGGPLAMGLGVLLAITFGSMFLSPTTALGAGLHTLSLYGGVTLFGLFLSKDTQRVVRNAKIPPKKNGAAFDPINNSIHIYLDVIKIFEDVAVILMESESDD